MKKRTLITLLTLTMCGSLISYKGFRYHKKEISKLKSRINTAERRIETLEESILFPELLEFHIKEKDILGQFYVNDGYRNPAAYIAHGGGIGEFTYSNSLDAVLDSVQKKNFQFVEIDLLETTDGKLVGGHDWKSLHKLTGSSGEDALTSTNIQNLSIAGKYKPIFGKDIKKLMIDNKRLVIITDKIKNYHLIAQELPELNRVIVEIFDIFDYLRAIRAGIKLPAFHISSPKQIRLVRKLKFPIVTIDAPNFFNTEENISLVQQLHNEGVTIFLAWVSYPKKDAPEWIHKYLGRTVSKIYTDQWSPSMIPE